MEGNKSWLTVVAVALGPVVARVCLVGVLTALVARGVLPPAVADQCAGVLLPELFGSLSRPSELPPQPISLP